MFEVNVATNFIGVQLIGHQLIAYVRAWQNVVNDLAMQHGNTAFQFNTYIISVLVIFFLQVNYGIPVVCDASILVGSFNTVQASQSIVDETKDFDRMLNEFFHFYGTRYEINNHLISARIGRWQEIRLAGQQKHFSAEQKRYVLFGFELIISNFDFDISIIRSFFLKKYFLFQLTRWYECTAFKLAKMYNVRTGFVFARPQCHGRNTKRGGV